MESLVKTVHHHHIIAEKSRQHELSDQLNDHQVLECHGQHTLALPKGSLHSWRFLHHKNLGRRVNLSKLLNKQHNKSPAQHPHSQRLTSYTFHECISRNKRMQYLTIRTVLQHVPSQRSLAGVYYQVVSVLRQIA